MKKISALFCICLVLLASCTPMVIKITIGGAAATPPEPTASPAGASAGAASGAGSQAKHRAANKANLTLAESATLPASTAAAAASTPAVGANPTAGTGSPAAENLNSEPSGSAVSSSAAPGCAASSPSSGAYTVTVCFATPAGGASLSGVVTTTVKVSVSGTSPGVRRVVFYLNGAYLLTDYQGAYTFDLPTAKWVDGAYQLEANALMRDGFNSTKAALSVNFSNGITSPLVNNNQFTPATGTTPASGAPFVVMAAGDGAGGELNAGKVVTLIQNTNPNLFLYLGDVYEEGSPAEFYNYYGTNGAFFDRFRAITDPTVGNHEYLSSKNASGYFDYWNNIPSYYSFNAGGWHFISLNSNSSRVKTAAGSPQYTWLQQDLAANSAACTVVFYHHPYFNIGPEGPTTTLDDIWQLLAKNHVSIVLNGHDHDYQRWQPLDGSGSPDPNGITEFVIGSGGHGLQTISKSDNRVAYSDNTNPEAFGALKLVLSANSAQFSYLSITGSVLDQGTVTCKK